MHLRIFRGKYALVIGAVVAVLAAQQLLLYLSAPPQEPFEFTYVERGTPQEVYVTLGPMKCSTQVIQLAYGGDMAKFPHYSESIVGDRVDASTGLRVQTEWHACNPSVWGSGEPYNQTSGGAGVLDSFTSGGTFHVSIDGGEGAAIRWILAGCSRASCTIDLPPLVAERGRLLDAVLDYHSRLRDKILAEGGAGLPEAPATTEALPDGRVGFLDNDGRVVTTADKDAAKWALQVKAAFRESYAAPSEETAERVIFLMLDEVLSNKSFLQEVRLALSGKNSPQYREVRQALAKWQTKQRSMTGSAG